MIPDLVIEQMEPRLKAALDLRHEVRIAHERLKPFVRDAGLHDHNAWSKLEYYLDQLQEAVVMVIGEECAVSATTAPETIRDMLEEEWVVKEGG